MAYVCTCKDCKKMKKKGYILRTRRSTHFASGWSPDGSVGTYSAYVKYFKYQPGRRPDVKFDKNP